MTLLRKVKLIGIVDEGNSTITILDPAGINVFTGNPVEILDFGIVFVNITSDVASATDGLSIQQSADGVNWDHDDSYTIAAGATKNFSINPHSKFYRIVYTNGAVIQGYFRLQTILKGNSKPSSHRIKDEIIGDDDCTLVKAALTGENGFGEWHNVKVTHDGNLTVSDNSSGLSIAEGHVSGKTFIHKFGNAESFSSGDNLITVWDGADDVGIDQMVYQYSTIADIDSLSCENDGDVFDIEIQGLDVNYNVVIQTITLTGQTRKVLDINLIRVFRMKNVGSVNNAGHIYCYVDVLLAVGIPTDSTKIRAVIQPENNQTLMAIYTIPNGKTGYMRSWFAGFAGAKKSTDYIIELRARPFGQVFQIKHKSSLVEGATSYFQHSYVEPEMFNEKTDIEMRADITAVSVTGASVSAGFDIVLIDN